MAATLVQSTALGSNVSSGANVASTVTLTLSSVVAGDLLVVAAIANDSQRIAQHNASGIGVSDSGANTWAMAVSDSNLNIASLWYAVAKASGTVTITVTAQTLYIASTLTCGASAWRGVSGSGTLLGTGSQSVSSSTSLTTTATASVPAGSLVLGVYGYKGQLAGTASASDGKTALQNNTPNAANTNALFTDYLLGSASGPQTAAFSETVAPATADGLVAAFAVASGGAVVTPRPIRHSGLSPLQSAYR